MTNKQEIDWTAVKNFFEAILAEGEEIRVIVASDFTGTEMEVRIPEFKVVDFMQHLPTFEADVRPLEGVGKWAIINRYHDPEKGLVVAGVTMGGFATQAEAEEHNQNYPSPEFNIITKVYL